MPTTDAATGEVVHYITECPLDPEGCKGQSWNKNSWGYSKEDAIARFKLHLCTKHRFVSPLVDTICADLKWSSYTCDEPIPRRTERIPSPTGRGVE